MKKNFRNILSVVLASLFLVSFTGIQMLVHYCMSCNTTEYNLDFSEQKCTNHEPIQSTQTCCSIDIIKDGCCEITSDAAQCDDCCSHETFYLKNDYQVAYERHDQKILPVVFSLLPSVLHEVVQQLSAKEDHSLMNALPPPPMRTGKDFILYSHQIKIAQI
jgi:hypothetical protein